MLFKQFLVGLFLAAATAFFIGLAFNYDPNSSSLITPQAISRFHKKFLIENQPHLNMVQESVRFQVTQCDQNIGKINTLKRMLPSEDSQKILKAKQFQIVQQRQHLVSLLQRINSEIEKGIIFSEFNTIDQGGIRSQHISEIIKECKSALNQAEAFNKTIASL